MDPQPLTPALFQVLLALADRDQHGYGILKEVERQTLGDVRLSTGTLYGIIKRLVSDGLIAEVPTRLAPDDDDQRRRYYTLTPQGRATAIAEAERMEKVIATARQKRLLRTYATRR